MKTKWIRQEIKGKILEWGDVAPKCMSFEEAEMRCEEQGGRLPTSAELLLALEQGVEGFNIDYYWAGTPYPTTDNNGIALYVNFDLGYVNSTTKTASLSVRCVRDVK